ncbi:MAG: hypothetical protein LBT81_06080 [Helicobacteraceae bacterium]|jgi:hypothetical protein|nr:hypothetical protein [Helicobacteraceae bacterium]
MKRIIFLVAFALPLLSEDFIVSYRAVMKDHRLYNENFQVTRSMIAHPKSAVTAVFETPTDGTQSVLKSIRQNSHTVIEELLRRGIMLTDTVSTHNETVTTKTVVTLKALKVSAAVKGDVVRITVLED